MKYQLAFHYIPKNHKSQRICLAIVRVENDVTVDTIVKSVDLEDAPLLMSVLKDLNKLTPR